MNVYVREEDNNNDHRRRNQHCYCRLCVWV